MDFFSYMHFYQLIRDRYVHHLVQQVERELFGDQLAPESDSDSDAESELMPVNQVKLASFLSSIDKFKESINYNKNFKREFQRLTTHKDRVAYCAKNPEIHKLIGEFIRGRTTETVEAQRLKSATKARELRLKGMDLCEKSEDERELMRALDCYNKALSYAPNVDGSNNLSTNDGNKQRAGATVDSLLPLIYGDRSMLFYQLDKFEESLLDIDCALKSGYAKFEAPTELKLRKCDCLLKLDRSAEAKELFYTISESERNDEEFKELSEELEKAFLSITEQSKPFENVSLLKDPLTLTHESEIEKSILTKQYAPHEQYRSLSSKVGLRTDPKRPKQLQLVAKEEIKSQELVHIGKPFACALYAVAELKYCHHCARLLLDKGIFGHRAVPCTGCAGILYCSEECRLASWTAYHQYECKIRLLYDHPHVVLALRSLFITGLEKVREIATRTGPLSTEITDWEDYALLYQLDDYVQNKKLDKLVGDSMYACLLTRLCKMSGFLGNDARVSPDLEKHIGSILFHHLLQMDYVAKHVTDGPTKVACELSLIPRTFEYSCEENLTAEQKKRDDGQLTLGVFRAMRTIPAGTLLTMPPWERQSAFLKYTRAQRQRIFREALERDCACDRCQLELRDSPKPEGSPYYPLRCPAIVDKEQCNGLITKRTGGYKCEACGTKKRNADIFNYYATIEQKLSDTNALISTIERALRANENSSLILPLVTRVYSCIIKGKLATLLHHDSSWQLAELIRKCATYYDRLGEEDSAFQAQGHALDILKGVHGADSSQVRAYLREMHPTVVKLLDKLLAKKISADEELKNLYLFMRISEFYGSLEEFNIPYEESEVMRLASRLGPDFMASLSLQE